MGRDLAYVTMSHYLWVIRYSTGQKFAYCLQEEGMSPDILLCSSAMSHAYVTGR